MKMKTITIKRPLCYERALALLTAAGARVISCNAVEGTVTIDRDADGVANLPADLQADIDVFDAEIRGYRTAYAEGKPEISDDGYDAVVASRDLLADALAAVGGHPAAALPVDIPAPKGRPRVKHAAPILSLDNARDIAAVRAFGARVHSEALAARVILEPKLDGITLVATYESGRLIAAATRGDGIEGEDILRLVRGTVAGLPNELPISGSASFVVRGEIVIARDDFAKLAADGYAKARNLVAGTVASGDRDLAHIRKLRFVVHGIESIGTFDEVGSPISRYSQAIVILAANGFETLLPYARAAFTDALDDLAAKAEALAADVTGEEVIPYECDGVVIKADAFLVAKTLGAHSTAPKWAVAYKWKKPGARTTIRGVEHSLAASGRITPVLLVDPVVVSGAEIRRVTGHNYQIAAGYAVGDKIEVERAGDVIPKAGAVVWETPDRVPIAPPAFCPACGGVVVHGEDGEPRCAASSEGGCAGMAAAALVKLAARDALDLPDVGPTAAEAIFTRYRSVAEVIAAGEAPWREQIGGARGEKVIQRLDMLREDGVDLARLLVGLGIPALGTTKAKALARHFGSLDKILEATTPDLVKAGLGPGTAGKVRLGLRGRALEVIEALVTVGIMPNETLAETTPVGPLSGEVVCITGTLSKPRAEVAAMVEAAGGKIATSVGRSTTVLVAGADAGSKLEAAKTRGVPVVTEGEILWVIGGGKRGEAWAPK